MEPEDQVAVISAIMLRRDPNWAWFTHQPMCLRDAVEMNNATARASGPSSTGSAELDAFNAWAEKE